GVSVLGSVLLPRLVRSADGGPVAHRVLSLIGETVERVLVVQRTAVERGPSACIWRRKSRGASPIGSPQLFVLLELGCLLACRSLRPEVGNSIAHPDDHEQEDRPKRQHRD